MKTVTGVLRVPSVLKVVFAFAEMPGLKHTRPRVTSFMHRNAAGREDTSNSQDSIHLGGELDVSSDGAISPSEIRFEPTCECGRKGDSAWR